MGAGWRSLIASCCALLSLLATPELAAAAWCEETYQSGTVESVRTRDVQVTYREPVTRRLDGTRTEVRITRYITGTRTEYNTVTRTGTEPVYDYYYVHFNQWWGGEITSCVTYSLPANCGSHGSSWQSHWDETVWYVAYYRSYEYPEVVASVVTFSVPVWEAVQVPYSHTVTEWVTRTRSVQERYSVFEPVYSTRSLWCPGDGTTNRPVAEGFVLTYDPAGGTGVYPAARRYDPGTAVTLSPTSLTRKGYLFDGWVNDTGTRLTAVTMTRDITVRARWRSYDGTALFTLTYDGAGAEGVAPPSARYPIGSVVIPGGAGSLTRSGFVFAGWSDGRDRRVTYVLMNSDRTLYAVWVPARVRAS